MTDVAFSLQLFRISVKAFANKQRVNLIMSDGLVKTRRLTLSFKFKLRYSRGQEGLRFDIFISTLSQIKKLYSSHYSVVKHISL